MANENKKITKLVDLLDNEETFEGVFVGIYTHDSQYGKSVLLFDEGGQALSVNRAVAKDILENEGMLKGTKFRIKFKQVFSRRYNRSFPVIDGQIHIIASLPNQQSQTKLVDERVK